MNDFTYMHIYFFITTIGVILVTILAGIFLVYSIKILKDLKHISAKARIEADLITEDIAALRNKVKSGRALLESLGEFFSVVLRRGKRRHKS